MVKYKSSLRTGSNPIHWKSLKNNPNGQSFIAPNLTKTNTMKCEAGRMCARERAAILHSLHYSLRQKEWIKTKKLNPYYNANYVNIAWGRFLCNRFFRRRSSLVFWWSVRAVRTNIRQGFLSAAKGWCDG